MEQLSGGYINEVWRTNGHVTKAYKTHEHITLDPDTRFKQEIDALSAFGGDLAPKLYSIDHIARTLNCEFVEGENMRLSLPEMTPEAQATLFKGMGRSLSELHNKKTNTPVEDYSYSIRQKAITDYQALAKSGACEYVGVKSDVILTRLIRQVLPTVARESHKQKSLSYIHGDFWSNNVMGNPKTGEINRIIDWEYFNFGMPQDDIAYTYLWDLRNHEGAYESFMEGYGEIDGVVEFAYLKALDLVRNATLEGVKRENGSGFVTDHLKLL